MTRNHGRPNFGICQQLSPIDIYCHQCEYTFPITRSLSEFESDPEPIFSRPQLISKSQISDQVNYGMMSHSL